MANCLKCPPVDSPVPTAFTNSCRPMPCNPGGTSGTSGSGGNAAMRINMKWAKLCRIYDHMYTGGAIALNSRIIHEQGISFIINATVEAPTLFLNGVDTMKLWVKDTPETDLSPHMDTVADMVHYVSQNGGKALVHCVAGVSRSAALVMAYLMKYKRMSLREAYHFLAGLRPVVRPSVVFWHQLIEYEKRIRGVSRGSVRFVDVPGSQQQLPDVYMVTLEEEEEEEPEENSSHSSESEQSPPQTGQTRKGDVSRVVLFDHQHSNDSERGGEDSGMDTEHEDVTFDPTLTLDPMDRLVMPSFGRNRRKHPSCTTNYSSSTDGDSAA